MEPDPFRIKYRGKMTELIREVVETRCPPQETSLYIAKWTEEHISAVDRQQFQENVETDLLNLTLGKIARYQISLTDFERWKMQWDGA